MPDRKEKWLVAELGMVPYGVAYRLQTHLARMRVCRESDRNIVLLLEHPPVFTLGKRGDCGNLLVKEAFLAEEGIDIVATERGGDITFHGRGQLLGYFIVDISVTGRDLRRFVYNLEEVMILAAAEAGVTAVRNPGRPGVWADGRKLGSIGIAIRKGITLHGFALNIEMDLLPFSWINPCGLSDIRMTSLSELMNKSVPMPDVAASVRRHLESVFHVEAESITCMEFERRFGFKLNSP